MSIASLKPSRLGAMKARFQQKQLEEKEEKLTQLYERQQQRTLERVVKSKTGLQRTQFGTNRNSFDGRLSGETSPGALSSTSTSSTSSQKMIGNGRVRQMFAERRGPKPAGIDKSYPLEPLPEPKNSKRGQNLDRTFTKDDVSTKFENLQIFQHNGNGTLSPFSLIDRQNNNESLDDENFPELKLIDDDDLDASFGKLPNVVKMLPSQVEANRFGGGKTTRLGEGDIKPRVNGNSNVRKIGPVKTDVRKTNTTVVKPPIRKTIPPEKRVSPVPTEMNTQVRPPPLRTTTRKVVTSPIRKQTASPTKRAEQTPGSVASRDDLSICNYCNRSFAADRLPKHQEICAKTTQKKRKPYDALKHRVVGTEAEAYVKKGIRNPSPAPAKNKNSDWRRKHEEFIATIRAAKQVSEHLAKGGNIRDLPPPPPSSNPDYVECPHCLRKFNQAAAERHIPKCKNYSFNKKPTPVKKTSLKR